MQGIVFDLDGTLVETAPDLHLVLEDVMATIDLPAPALAEVRGMVGDGARALIEKALNARGVTLPASEVDRLYDRFIERYTAEPCRQSHLFNGVEEVLEQFSARDIKMAICTNKPERPAVLLMEALGVRDYFGSIIGGDTLPVRKPDAGPLLAALSAISAAPEQSVMVGDSRNDVLTARAAGLPCILVSFGYTTVAARDLAADRVIDDFKDLPDAVAAIMTNP